MVVSGSLLRIADVSSLEKCRSDDCNAIVKDFEFRDIPIGHTILHVGLTCDEANIVLTYRDTASGALMIGAVDTNIAASQV